MVAAALLQMHDRGIYHHKWEDYTDAVTENNHFRGTVQLSVKSIRHHFHGNPHNGNTHYRGITVVPITMQDSIPMTCLLAVFTIANQTDSLKYIQTDQCRRNVCKNAESPSMTSRMATVSTAHGANRKKINTEPNEPPTEKPIWSTMFHRTSDSSGTHTHRHHHHTTHSECVAEWWSIGGLRYDA